MVSTLVLLTKRKCQPRILLNTYIAEVQCLEQMLQIDCLGDALKRLGIDDILDQAR